MGYGVAGHKNSFSANVKEGNWVEDKFGFDLAAIRTRSKQIENSEHRSNFGDPAAKARPPSPDVKVRDLKGLEAAVLFNHGPRMFETEKVTHNIILVVTQYLCLKCEILLFLSFNIRLGGWKK